MLVLLDLMQNAQLQWPTKLDDWNAMALEFNQRIEAMGFTHRNGKSLRKKWQVLCSAKQPAEGEELTEQEKRAKAINARGPMGGQQQGRPAGDMVEDEAARKRIKVDHDAGSNGVGSSASSGSSGTSASPLAPVLAPLLSISPVPLTTADNAALIAEVQSLLTSREKAREQQVAMFDEWRRRDEQERQQFDRLVQALATRVVPQSNAQQPQLNPPQQPLQHQQQSNMNGGVGSNL